MLELQTVWTQPVKTSSTSTGAERHAQSSVTSSHPEGSARPIGMRQLKMQDGCDDTAGNAVIVYSGEVEVDAAALMDISIVLEVEDWAADSVTKRNSARKYTIRGMIVENRSEKAGETRCCDLRCIDSIGFIEENELHQKCRENSKLNSQEVLSSELRQTRLQERQGRTAAGINTCEDWRLKEQVCVDLDLSLI